MLRFNELPNPWDAPDRDEILKREIEAFDAGLLPLQRGLSVGGYALPDGFSVMIVAVGAQGRRLRVKAGVFYHGVIAGCSCADDPSPTDLTTEYCELMFDIDRRTGNASVALVEDDAEA